MLQPKKNKKKYDSPSHEGIHKIITKEQLKSTRFRIKEEMIGLTKKQIALFKIEKS